MFAYKPEQSIVLAAGIRTPWVRAGGAFAREDCGHLGAKVARELFARTGVRPGDVDEVVTGCVGPAHDQANVGRVLALRAGVPREVPARTVARNCASGIEAVTTAATSIEAGYGSMFLSVGVEVMSAYPLIFGTKMTNMFARLSRARSLGARLGALGSFRPSFLKPRIALLEGLTDPTCDMIMGSTAERLAREFSITREESDAYAVESHMRAKNARSEGRLAREIVPHMPNAAKRGQSSVGHDDGIRDEQTVAALGKLRPYFEKPDGVVTVGNSCGITDGAAALLIAREDRARELGLQPLARIRSWAWAGLDPARMGLGPVFSSAAALDSAGCTLGDMGAIEINEAFAAQVLACMRAAESTKFCQRELGRSTALGEWDPALTNKNGGAIALGHPVGATGARILLTTALELQTSDAELGLATLCIGGGQGGAVVLERLAA